MPFTVGVTPGVSDDEEDDEDVSGPEDELIELMVSLTAPGAISFLGIDFEVPAESILVGKDLLDSVEGSGSTSSFCLDSCEERGVPALSAARSGFGESVRGMPMGASLRGMADTPPPDVDLDTLPSPNTISDCELLLEVPDFFPFGTSPNRNFSFEVWFLPFVFEVLGDLACWSRVSSPPIAGDSFVEDPLVPPVCALLRLSLIREASSADGCRPFS